MFSRNIENFEREEEIVDPLKELAEDERQRQEADKIFKERENKKKIKDLDRMEAWKYRKLAEKYGKKIIDSINNLQNASRDDKSESREDGKM